MSNLGHAAHSRKYGFPSFPAALQTQTQTQTITIKRVPRQDIY